MTASAIIIKWIYNGNLLFDLDSSIMADRRRWNHPPSPTRCVHKAILYIIDYQDFTHE